MPGLIDIAPAYETVAINERPIAVKGVSVEDFGTLLYRFPELRALMSGVSPEKIGVEVLFKLGGGIIAAIIVSGLDLPEMTQEEREAQEKSAKRLALEHQVSLLEAIIRATLPNGLAAFLEQINRLMAVVTQEGPSTKAQASNGRKARSNSSAKDSQPSMS